MRLIVFLAFLIVSNWAVVLIAFSNIVWVIPVLPVDLAVENLIENSITSSAQFPTELYEIVCRSACEPVVCWCLC